MPDVSQLLALREYIGPTDPLAQAHKAQGGGGGPIDIELVNRYVERRKAELAHVDAELMKGMR